MSYTDVFGGDNKSPAQLDYLALSISADTTLVWAFQTGAGTNFAAHKIDVTPSTGGLSLIMPDARLVSAGQDLMIYNAGANTVTVKDAAGGTLGSVGSGQAWIFYLRATTTQAGSWRAWQEGTGTSSATAASLVSYGLKAYLNTIMVDAPISTKNANYNIDTAGRMTVYVNTGGAISFTFTSAATLTNGWFCFVRNDGSGTLTLDPSGAETIDGAGTKQLAPGESCVVFSDGTNLRTVGYGRQPVQSVTAISIATGGGAGTTVLSATEVAAQVQNYTGVLTGNRIIELGTGAGYWFVYNNTSGAYTVTFRTNGADPGVVVTQGNFSILRSNGTTVSIAFTATSGTVTNVATGTDLTGGPITTTGTIAHDVSGVTPATYGSASQSPEITVNSRGHVTNVVNRTITAAWGSLTGIPNAISALASTTPAADLLAYFTGAATAATTAITSFGRSLIAAADAAAARVLITVLTTNGDLWVRAGGVDARLAVGTEGYLLTVVGGAPAWAVAPTPATPVGLMPSVINGGMVVAQRVTAPNISSSYQYGAVDRMAAKASGTAVSAGTIAHDTACEIGRTAFGLALAAVTVTGTGKVYMRYRMESRDARRFKNQTISVGVLASHDVGSTLTADIYINKANAADDFSAVTSIGSATGISFPTGISSATTVKKEALAMGDCSNGVEIEVVVNCGAVTTKWFKFTELRIEVGSTLPDFQYVTFVQELERCKRYYQKSYDYTGAPGAATTEGLVGGSEVFFANAYVDSGSVEFEVEMRTAPTVAYYDGNGNSSKLSYTGHAGTTFTHNVSPSWGSGPFNVSRKSFLHTGYTGAQSMSYLHYTADAEL
jgi:hypothetical protein